MSQQTVISILVILSVVGAVAIVVLISKMPDRFRGMRLPVIALIVSIAALVFSLWVNFRPSGS